MPRRPKTQRPHDHADLIHAQWEREAPDIDLSGARILARAGRITIAARKPIDEVFAKHGIDSGEFYVLSALRRAGEPYRLRPTEIFRSLMISSGGLTDRLDRLEKKGLVSRREADEDKRSLLVELTREGKARIEAAFREDMALENRLVAGLTKDEQAELTRLLRKLAIDLDC